MKNIVLSLFFLSLLHLGNSQTIDSQLSTVEFKIGSVGFSKVKGSFSNLKGSVRFDERELSQASFNVSIDVATINTGKENRDEHLKNADFFEVEKFPVVRFISSSVTKTANSYLVKGKLTMKGITKDVSIPFDLKNEGKNKILDGEFEVNRLDYNVGVGQSKILVKDKVKLSISCVLSN